MIIKVKITTNKIDKARLFKGNKHTFLDCTLLENRDGVDSYGNNGMVIQDVSKEERLAGTRGAIIGNFKILSDNPNRQSEPKSNPNPAPSKSEADDSSDIPF